MEKLVFFGNEKLATGIPTPRLIIHDAVQKAGFEIEKNITGPLSDLGTHESKLAVLAAYGRIIPQSVLDEFPLGIINVHPSLLPIYRGPTPIEQAILDGTSKTGVSIMRLTAGMDEGPVYKQRIVQLTGQESKIELVEQLQKLGAELLIEVLPHIADRSLKPRNQPHPGRATYSHLLTKEDGVIDWNKPAKQIKREIRAYSGWPGSRTTLAGKEVIITKARVSSSKYRVARGKILAKNRQLIIGTGQKSIEIERLKPAGKKEMSVGEFIRGYLHS